MSLAMVLPSWRVEAKCAPESVSGCFRIGMVLLEVVAMAEKGI